MEVIRFLMEEKEEGKLLFMSLESRSVSEDKMLKKQKCFSSRITLHYNRENTSQLRTFTVSRAGANQPASRSSTTEFIRNVGRYFSSYSG